MSQPIIFKQLYSRTNFDCYIFTALNSGQLSRCRSIHLCFISVMISVSQLPSSFPYTTHVLALNLFTQLEDTSYCSMKNRCFCSQEGIFCAGLLSWLEAAIMGCGTKFGRRGGEVCTSNYRWVSYCKFNLLSSSFQSLWPFLLTLKKVYDNTFA